MAIHVGIGSWGDDDYVGVLYPKGLPKSDRLRELAKSLGHVEVNSTYYATPTPAVVQSWVDQTPPGFTFSVKLHRAFSQSPAKTVAKGELVERLLTSVDPLVTEQRLSAFLLVMPPRFTPATRHLAELDTLVEKLAPHPLAVELRHKDWVTASQREATLTYFRERKLILVGVDMPKIAGSTLMPPLDEVTHPHQAYLRLHGRNPHYLDAESAAAGHHYAYDARELTGLATRVRKLADQADHVFVIANNHAEDFAPKTALALKAKLGA